LLLLAALLALLAPGAVASAEIAPRQIVEAVVVRVIDSDTLQVRLGDRLEMVRYIGINTPEIHHPTKGREVYGDQAREANRSLVEGQRVRLVFDVRPRDRFGRLPAYVFVGDLFVNAQLLRDGFAEVATFPPNVRYRDSFVVLQKEARTARRGLWADADAKQHYKPRASGVFVNERLRIYLHPDDPSRHLYLVDPMGSFESEADAKAAGYSASMDYAVYRAREVEAQTGVRQAEAYGAVGLSGGGTSSGLSGTSPSFHYGDQNVRGYTRRDGTYVAPYTRSTPRR
jgi:micrococcal nuclease